jgi:hypothetical protein
MKILNFDMMANPLNYLIIFLMLIFAGLAAEVLLNFYTSNK